MSHVPLLARSTVPKLQSPRRGPQVLSACSWRIVLLRAAPRAAFDALAWNATRARPTRRRTRCGAAVGLRQRHYEAPVCRRDARRFARHGRATWPNANSGLANKCKRFATCGLCSRAKTEHTTRHTIQRWERRLRTITRFRSSSRSRRGSPGMKAKRRVLGATRRRGCLQDEKGKPDVRDRAMPISADKKSQMNHLHMSAKAQRTTACCGTRRTSARSSARRWPSARTRDGTWSHRNYPKDRHRRSPSGPTARSRATRSRRSRRAPSRR